MYKLKRIPNIYYPYFSFYFFNYFALLLKYALRVWTAIKTKNKTLS